MLVTSDFHMERAKALFEGILGLTIDDVKMYCASTPTYSMDEEVLTARKQREASSLENWRCTQSKILTVSDFARWFFEEHNAYSCNMLSAQTGVSPSPTRKFRVSESY